MHEGCRLCGEDLFLVGDQIWDQPPSIPKLYQPFLLLDAVMNQDVYGDMGEPAGHAGAPSLDNYYETQPHWRRSAWEIGRSRTAGAGAAGARNGS